ncbi:ATP-binding protein [Candidatus Uhrbacteria bacterium]|nr:ATP-binding protein [Candidatus Uhrbacteria bacterium]
MYIKRNLEETILRYLNAPEIIAVVGPRQAGKTSLVSHLFEGLKGAVLLSFEDQRILGLFEKNIDDFITAYVRGNRYLFIDEFQYAHSGGKLLKYIYDTQKIKIVISGSSAIDLTVRATKYLVGRILIFQLYPFDFREYVSATDEAAAKLLDVYRENIDFTRESTTSIPKSVHAILLKHYEDYLLFGGYPRVVLEQNRTSKKELLRNIYNTYFLREVRDILGLIDDYKLSNLIQGLALQIGNLIEYNELSRLSEYSFSSVKKYINFFEKTYICRRVRPYYTNKRTEIVKNPKIFFFDAGLRNSVVNDFRPLRERNDAGALAENGIAMEAIKKEYQLNFWRDKKKHEVDFIVSMGEDRRIAVESRRYATVYDLRILATIKNAYPSMPTFLSYCETDGSIKGNGGAFPAYLF